MGWAGTWGVKLFKCLHSAYQGAWPKEEIQRDLELSHCGLGVQKGSFHSRMVLFVLLILVTLSFTSVLGVSEGHWIQAAPSQHTLTLFRTAQGAPFYLSLWVAGAKCLMGK